MIKAASLISKKAHSMMYIDPLCLGCIKDTSIYASVYSVE